jgi:hypothetical protein
MGAMGQVFRRSTNTLSRVTAVAVAGLAFGSLWLAGSIQRSSYATEVNVAKTQPIPFGHDHHVGGLGIDCRYCHGSVEETANAGMPPTATCMNCHRQIWSDSPMLEPVRESYRTNTPIRWNRVHDLPDFVYFNHSIHVARGVGCTSCHGRVDQMPLLWQEYPLHMDWCLDCHRNPSEHLRPKEAVFDMEWTPPPDQAVRGRELAAAAVGLERPQSCSHCHR